MATERVEFINLFDATIKDLDRLSKQVKKARGELTIMVHPYFERIPKVDKEIPFRSSPVYNVLRDALINNLLVLGLPLVIFEEAYKTDKLPQNIRTNKSGTIYIVDTKPENPGPLSRTWDEVAEKLRGRKVESIEVGGLVLRIDPVSYDFEDWNEVKLEGQFMTSGNAMDIVKTYADKIAEWKGVKKVKAYSWINNRIFPWGCVGQTVLKLLARGFDVTISKVTEIEKL